MSCQYSFQPLYLTMHFSIHFNLADAVPVKFTRELCCQVEWLLLSSPESREKNLSLLLLFPTSVVPPLPAPSLVSPFLQREKCWKALGLGPSPHSTAVLPPVRTVSSSAAVNAISMLMIPQIRSAGLILCRALDC